MAAKETTRITNTDGRRRFSRWFVASGLSKSAVARALGVTAQAVGAWLDGISRPKLHIREHIEKLAGIERTAWELANERAKRAHELELVQQMARAVAGDSDQKKGAA
jgi:transcriptional regulator with XRE-family HTH domain